MIPKQTTGEDDYEYILLCVDKVLVISEHTEQVLLKEIGQEIVIAPEEEYLEANTVPRG